MLDVDFAQFSDPGRLRDNKLTMQGVGSSHVWRKLIEKRNVAAGFNLTLQDDPYLPTDVTSFYTKNVPVLNFFTGAHEDYHRPTDTAEKINYEGLERIAKLSQQIVLDVAHDGEAFYGHSVRRRKVPLLNRHPSQRLKHKGDIGRHAHLTNHG